MKKPLFGILISVILAVAPMVPTLIAGAIADSNDCKLHEGFSNPCIVLGSDIGELLYGMGMMFWFALATVPLGIMAGIVCIVWLLIVLYKGKNNKKSVEDI